MGGKFKEPSFKEEVIQKAMYKIEEDKKTGNAVVKVPQPSTLNPQPSTLIMNYWRWRLAGRERQLAQTPNLLLSVVKLCKLRT